MGNENYPVRRGTIGPGAPTKYDHQQIAAKIKAASSGELHNLSGTYATLERLLAQARSDLAFHRGRLKAAWPQGPSADAALAEIKRLEQAAGELSEASGKFRTALMAAGRTVDTYKATNLSAATGALGTVPDPKQDLLMEKLAKDREAQRHMDQMNQGLISAYSTIPPSVSMDLPGHDEGESLGEGGRGSGLSTGLGASQPGAQGLPPSATEPVGQVAPTAQGDPSDIQGPPRPGDTGLGGTELEGTTPSVVGTSSGNPGQAPGGIPNTPAGSGPSGGSLTGPPPTGVGGLKPGSMSPRLGGLAGPGTLGAGSGSPRPGVIGGRPMTTPMGGVSGQVSGGASRGLSGMGSMGPNGVIGRSPSSSGVGDSGRARGTITGSGTPGPVPLGRGGTSRSSASNSERPTLYCEDEDVWADDDDTVPPVIR